jgi:hypothetical protein
MPENRKNSGEISEQVIEGKEPPDVGFRIRAAREIVLPGTELYDCTYESGGRTARFRLELKQSRTALDSDLPMFSASGRFIAVDGSDNYALLEELMKALEAGHFPKHVHRLRDLPFDAVVLGQKQSRSPSGGFSEKPPGDWKAIKIFLPPDGDDGEVFLNLNPVLEKGELSMKDSDYGDYVLAQLARVL